jgi:H+/Cl- antiporter ClcA
MRPHLRKRTRACRDVRLCLAVVLTGAAAGAAGIALSLLLHTVQHVAFGYDLGPRGGSESFLEGVTAADPPRRLLSLLGCGAVAGGGWFLIGRLGRPLVSVREAIAAKPSSRKMPFVETVAHCVLQIITVALGSPLGREVAPREAGALLADRLGRAMRLRSSDAKLLIACGAGSGLAAVYDVPLGGAVFVLEVLVAPTAARQVAAAVSTCAIASFVARVGVGNAPQYVVPPVAVSFSLILCAATAGPILGLAGTFFRRAAAICSKAAPTGLKRMTASLIAFGGIGALAMFFPQLPGNGRGPMQLALDGGMPLALTVELLLLKTAAVAAALRGGASGGLLTPGMTVGALAGLLLGTAWNSFAPALPAEALAVVGGAAFLAASMNMPLTAVVLAMEFTRLNGGMLLPIVVAVGGSAWASSLLRARRVE